MQNQSVNTSEAAIETVVAPLAAIAQKLQAKRSANVAAGKPANSAAPKAKTAKPAKPTNAAREAARKAASDNRAFDRSTANGALAQFVAVGSCPFKSASDKFQPLNGASRVCGATARQAGLIACLAAYGEKAFHADGSFTRNGFLIPASRLNPSDKSNRIAKAQPESGVISDGRGVRFSFVSGDCTPDARITLHVGAAIDCVRANLGDRIAIDTLRALASYGVRDAKAMLAKSSAGNAKAA